MTCDITCCAPADVLFILNTLRRKWLKLIKKGSRDAAQQVVNKKDIKESLIRERNWRNKWTINETSWTCVKCEWMLFLCPDSQTLQSTNCSQSCFKNNDEHVVLQISHVGPCFSFNSQIWQCGRSSQRAQSDEEPERSLAPSQENVLECFCKNSWPQHCRDEQWGQIMEIPTMWTFNCFQRQLALNRQHLTSSPFTNASLLSEFYPLLVFSSLLYIIKWPTACFSATDHSACNFFPQSFTGLCRTILRQLDPVLQWSWPNQYGSEADSVLHIICAQNKVRHARLETLPLMLTVFQMAPSVAASNNSSVQKIAKIKELWDSFWKEIIYGLNQKSSSQITRLIIQPGFLSDPTVFTKKTHLVGWKTWLYYGLGWGRLV